MTKIANIAHAMQGASATNGWDAILALNCKQVNALFFRQYLQHGPTNQYMNLRVMLDVDQTYWILDVKLGPPEISFQTGSGATLEMTLIEGSLIALDTNNQTILNAVRIRPKESNLTGSLDLKKVKGEVDQLGKVVADLGASAYTPRIGGVVGGGVLNQKIGDAVKTYFTTNNTSLTLGAIAPGTNVPDSLKPTEFLFTLQQKPNSSDACVLLLIQTNGQAGKVESLDAYPIPDDHTAALLISERIFQGTMIDALNKEFSQFPSTTFVTSGDRGFIANSGSMKSPGVNQVGQDGPNNYNLGFISGDLEFELEQLFTLAYTQDTITAKWEPTNKSTWLYKSIHFYDPDGGPDQPPFDYANATVSLAYHFGWQASPKVDGETNVVGFDGTVTQNWLNSTDDTNWFVKWFGHYMPDISPVADGLGQGLQNTFSGFSLPHYNAFALTSLLFQFHKVRMSEVALPADLYLTGSLAQPIEVSPKECSLTPGQTQQFSVAGHPATDFVWKIQPPRAGSIHDGLYTAPSTVSSAEVVVVVVKDENNTQSEGRAMVLVYQSPAANGVAVAPGSSLVTPGQSVVLSTTDANDNGVSVTWTLSPDLGKISSGFTHGQYTFVAPGTITDLPKTVTATAVNVTNKAQTGTAIIRIVPSATLTVAPANSAAKYGASVPLSASITGVNTNDLRWVVYPYGAGTVAADSNNPTNATYTAPARDSNQTEARVVAYLVSDQVAAWGSSDITLSS